MSLRVGVKLTPEEVEKLLNDVKQNISLIREIRDAADEAERLQELGHRYDADELWEKAFRLSDELRNTLRVPVLWAGNIGIYPALVINMVVSSNILAWIELDDNDFIAVVEEDGSVKFTREEEYRKENFYRRIRDDDDP